MCETQHFSLVSHTLNQDRGCNKILALQLISYKSYDWKFLFRFECVENTGLWKDALDSENGSCCPRGIYRKLNDCPSHL